MGKRTERIRTYIRFDKKIVSAVRRLAKKGGRFYTRSIVREAEINEKTFYNHYKSYDDFFEKKGEEVRKAVREADTDTPVNAPLNVYFENVLDRLYEVRGVLDIFIILNNTKLVDPILKAIRFRVYRTWREKDDASYRIFTALSIDEFLKWRNEAYSKEKIAEHAKNIAWFADHAKDIKNHRV
ncbi:MAG: hypothetical protein Q4E47_01965 [Candidatus Saccharibacteria bacterium]|nr:hypothetical protein [Candidatus Saccharibacteria bacterium]